MFKGLKTVLFKSPYAIYYKIIASYTLEQKGVFFKNEKYTEQISKKILEAFSKRCLYLNTIYSEVRGYFSETSSPSLAGKDNSFLSNKAPIQLS